MPLVLGGLLAFSATAAEFTKSDSPTFARDIAPIFQEKCHDCHNPGSAAPMSLITYNEVRPWSKSIKARVLARTMPPWFIDPTVGIQKFKEDLSLSTEQIGTIVRWVDAGSPMGDPKDMPAPKVLSSNDTWELEKKFGKPDLIVESAPYTMPAKGQEQWWRPVTAIDIAEPHWVRAMEIHPSLAGRKMTHHVGVHLMQNDEASAAGGGGELTSWAMGKRSDVFENGTGRLIVPGDKIWWDIHYRAVGEQITDHVQLGVWFYPKGEEPRHRAVLTGFQAFSSGRLDIEPNKITENNGYTVLRSATCFSSFQPHMHRRGKALSLEAILPDGSIQPISYVDRFNFNWIMNYLYADDAVPCFPKGTVVHVTTWHDNTAANPNNPDSRQWVGYGDRTVDEMAFAYVNVTAISDEEYSAWASTHKRETSGGRRASGAN